MARTKQYACGGNLSWIKMGFTTSPGVPYNQNSILKLKDFYFQGQEAPRRFPGLIIVAVSLQQAQNGMMSEKGAMESVSPPELVHAFVLRLAELIREKTSDDLLEGWLRVILSTMFMFELLPTVDDRSARADSLRESAVADYHGFAWTVLQKVYHLGLFRQRKERDLGTLSAQRVAQLYNEDSLNWVERATAADSEAITESYVDQAMTVWSRMLSCKEIADVLHCMDRTYGHDAPLNGIVQYQLMISKTRTQEMLLWCLKCIEQYFTCGYLTKGDLTTRQISASGGNKGTIDLFMFKRELLDHFLGSFVDEKVECDSTRKAIRAALESHDSHHKAFGWPKDDAQPDLTWNAAWLESERSVLFLAEGLVFSNANDPTLKQALKNRKSITEALQYGGVEELVKEIDKQIEKEKKESGQALPGTAPQPSTLSIDDDLETDEDKILKYRSMAMHTVKQRVKLIVEPVSESAFATALSDAEIGKMRGTQERRILALYDVKKCGESITAPHLRTAPLRKDHCQKAVRAFLQSRGSMEMHEHDLLFFMDAGKHGNDRIFSSLFVTDENKRIQHEKRTIFLSYSEVEMMHVFSRSNLEMPEVKRSIYPGSSSGDLVGPINVEKFSDRLWQVTEAEKKKYYGSFRIAVGGPTETSPQESAKRPQYKRSELARKPEGQDESIAFEPMAYSGAPPEFYKDLFHVWAPRAILDFTACDLTPAFIAIESKLPYLGVMYTEDHMVAGYKHLSQLVFEAMCDESSPLHD
ncbi:Uncharacterized protein SCF082_LOCUS7759, partial [Durusdinium trenchii]